MSRFGLALSAWLVVHQAAPACSVPVFRFALEQWQPAKYELVLYHRGPLTPAERDTVRHLEAESRRANVRVTDVDLVGAPDPDHRAVWERDGKNSTLPRLVLRYPDSTVRTPSVLTRPLTDSLDDLFNSPARRAVRDALTAGHAAVVVLLRSGDPVADQAARNFLRTELPRIARAINLPARTDDGPQVQSELPMRIEFPIVEVDRNSTEETLVRILLGSEDGLADVKGPIAFPIFGRGRALCSLAGKDLSDPAELRRSLEFLCKACSCQVKELNPGLDLLVSANWDTIFDVERGPPPRVLGAGGDSITERDGPAAGVAVAEMRSPPPAGYSAADLVPAAERPTAKRSPLLRMGTVVAGVAVLITGFWAFRGRRTPPPEQ